MTTGPEDAPANQSAQDGSPYPVDGDPARAAASTPNQPGPVDAPPPLDPTRTGQPAGAAEPDHTRTSSPDHTAAQVPTPQSQPGATPEAQAPPGVPQLRNPARYQILGEHGRGGLGKISRAHDLELGRDVAIKELISRNAMHEVRFMREALITARLEHPGIVPVHEAGRWPDGTPFYAMKLVAGRPLRDLLAERQTIDERLALLHHVIAIADAIAYAHRRNVIHRDLKPSNVIVGDFGETVVIDWGLAKNLSTNEDAASGGSLRAGPEDGLTSAGAILGTPAYMAPEQLRGEPVDERADVYAIGVMLAEICSLKKLAPHDSPRELVPHRSGIDPDLLSIVNKALDPDRARRYPDAGALAADLKAFKAGARITARQYSLWALLTHWTRRHRALTLSASVAIATLLAVTALYVRNIAAERDRADAEAVRAHRHEQISEEAKNEILLQHAELQLHTDPTAAAATLASYHGHDLQRLNRLRAETQGRGTATLTIQPHSSVIWFVTSDSTGTIFSLANDGRVRATRDGNSEVLASNVSTDGLYAYSPEAHLLAYATAPSGLALLNLETRTVARISFRDVVALDLAPDGSRFAAIDSHGKLTIWDVTRPTGPTLGNSFHHELPAGTAEIRFATPALILSHTQNSISRQSMDSERTKTVPHKILELSASPLYLATADAGGSIAIFSHDLELLARASACRQSVSELAMFRHHPWVAFGCKEGGAGIASFDEQTRQLAIMDRFDTKGRVYHTRPDAAERSIVVSSESSIIYIYDIETRATVEYQTRAGQVSQVFAGSDESRHILSAGTNGIIQRWSPPQRAVRVLMRGPAAIFHAAFSPRGDAIATDGADHVARIMSFPDGRIEELRDHSLSIYALQYSDEGDALFTASLDHAIDVWSSGGKLLRRFTDHADAVNDVIFWGKHRGLASVSDDGRLLLWRADDGAVTTLLTSSIPLTGIELLRYNDHVVVKDARGAMWDISADSKTTQIRQPDGVRIVILRASPRGRLAATGSETGEVVVYDTDGWKIIATTNVGGPIRELAFDPGERDLAIVSGNARVTILTLNGARALPWHELSVPAHSVTYTRDGTILAVVCDDGSAWFYHRAHDAWAYARDHFSDVYSGSFSPDSRFFASPDRGGVVTVRDMSMTFNKPEMMGR